MADQEPEFQPDVAGALRLVVVAVGRLGQAIEAHGASMPAGPVGGTFIQQAQQALTNASELLTDPNAAVSPEDDTAAVEPDPVDPVVDEAPPPADPPPVEPVPDAGIDTPPAPEPPEDVPSLPQPEGPAAA